MDGDENGEPKGQGRTTLPVPDPTRMTTQQLIREIAGLREILQTSIEGHKALFETRLNGMDKAIALVQVIEDRQSSDVDKKIAGLRTLIEEKFKSVELQFKERDSRGEQTARDTKVAVDAALQAAEKAVGKQNEAFSLSINKSENGTNKQIDQQGMLIASTTSALNDKIDDMKQRLTRIEGADMGQKTAVTTQQTSNSGTVSLIAVIIAAIGMVGSFIVAFVRGGAG